MNAKHIKAHQVYLNFRIYQHWLQENGLPDDSKDISVEALQDFVFGHIPEEDYTRLRQFCIEVY